MRHIRKTLYTLAGCVLAAVLLWALFRGTDWGALRQEIVRVKPGYLALATMALLGANVMRGIRMWPVLNHRQPVLVRQVFNATQISQLANMALPVRGGPIFRALVLSKIGGQRFSYLAGASFGDRCAEGVFIGVVLSVLSLILYFDLALPPSASSHATAVTMLGIAALPFATGLALYGLTRTPTGGQPGRLATAISRRFAARSHAVWGELRFGVADSLFSKPSRSIWAGAVLAFAGNVVAHAFMMRAFGLEPTWLAPVLGAVLAMVTFVLPGAPGLVGPYHAAIIGALGISMPESAYEVRLAMAIVMHAVHMAVLAALGTLALLLEHQSLFALEAAEDNLTAQSGEVSEPEPKAVP